ncbi:MAG TPA: hypothetical protein VMT38_01935 [Terracidiphilus sp.]|nr:hypothetical protein [Terracidiphilus sp.]
MKYWWAGALLACVPLHLSAQMQMGGAAVSLKANVLRHSASGTSLEPDSSSPPMLMRMSGKWMEMLHGEAIVAEQQQTGPRGRDKLFSVNWAMLMAQRSTAHGEWTFASMLSLEPATITGRYYPELFQQGETAFGRAIVDGQHPHDLFMELAVVYDLNLGEGGMASLYAAPVGDPALGPVAFPHRMSAESDPLAPLAHHLQDSTHIAYDVVTDGITWGPARIEASGFHGREPGENRWTIEAGALDSWSTRLTASLAKDWIAQYSIGHLHSPEDLHPQEDVLRQTTSIAVHHAWTSTELDATAVWGRNHTIGTDVNANGYLLEGAVRIRAKQSIWTRIENDDRTTDLLGAAAPSEESVVGRVQAFTGGYAHQIWHDNWSELELGAQATFYTTPTGLLPYYGVHPAGVVGELHWRIGR